MWTLSRTISTTQNMSNSLFLNKNYCDQLNECFSEYYMISNIKIYDPLNDKCFIIGFNYICDNDPKNVMIYLNDTKFVINLYLKCVDNISNYYSRNKLILLDPYAENLKVVLLEKCLMIYNDTFATRNYILINYHKQDINRYYDCKPRIDNILSLKIIFANYYASYYYLNFTREAINRYYTFKHFAYLAINNIQNDRFSIVNDMSYIIKLYNSLNDIRFMNDFIYCVCTNDPTCRGVVKNNNYLHDNNKVVEYEC